MQAAGGMIASIGDLARFVIAIMDGGMLDGRRVFPADVVAETQRVHARFSSRAGAIDRFGYGLGWNFGLLDGDTLVHHFGGFPGFSASVSFMPRHRIGVVQGGNGALSTPMHDLVMGYAYALLTGNAPALERYRQQIAALPQRAAQQRAAIAADRARRAARPQTTALPLEAYAGRYADEVFGTIDVTFQDGRIRARNGVLESVAEVYDGTKHMLRVELTPGSGSVLEFLVTDGRARLRHASAADPGLLRPVRVAVRGDRRGRERPLRGPGARSLASHRQGALCQRPRRTRAGISP
jgi:hypothetical protein